MAARSVEHPEVATMAGRDKRSASRILYAGTSPDQSGLFGRSRVPDLGQRWFSNCGVAASAFLSINESEGDEVMTSRNRAHGVNEQEVE